MYLCAISGMIREILKMDGRDRAECQNWEKRDKIGILEFVKSLKDKHATVSSPSFKPKAKKMGDAEIFR